MNRRLDEETTPDDLMEDFKGRGLGSIIFFTVVIHVIVLGASSVPFLYSKFIGKETAQLSEQERIDAAVREATASLRDIAEQHGLKPQDISSQFEGRAPKAPTPKTSTLAKKDEPTALATTSTEPETKTEEEKSTIEKELEKKAKGPELPKVEDEDLFK